MSPRKFFIVALFAIALALPLSAQTYDGSCTITGVTASSMYSGSGYKNTGGFSFTCTGNFYGRVTARLMFEDPNQVVCGWPSGTCGGAVYAMVSKQWPLTAYKCETMWDGSRYCFQYVKEAQPSTASLSHSVQSNVSRFTSRAVVEWVTGPCTTIGTATWCPTTSVTASKSSRLWTVTTN